MFSPTGNYPGLRDMHRLEVFLLPPEWEATLVNRQLNPFISSSFVGRATSTVENLAREHITMTWSGLESRLFNSESNALPIEHRLTATKFFGAVPV